MKFVDEFRDPKTARDLVETIRNRAQDRPLCFMEVCGTHTMAIYRYGIKSLLPPTLRLVSGPGCPVCVSPVSYIDRAIALTQFDHVAVATFGDMMRVPGSEGSLEEARSLGGQVPIVYSPLDAVRVLAATGHAV